MCVCKTRGLLVIESLTLSNFLIFSKFGRSDMRILPDITHGEFRRKAGSIPFIHTFAVFKVVLIKVPEVRAVA